MSFASLKKSSTNSFAKLASAIEKNSAKQSYTDDRFYVPNVDKNGNALVVMRFLPEADGDDSPFVKTYHHGFKNSAGQWYIENCRTTIGGKCLCCAENGKLWNDGTEASKQIARGRSRKTKYTSNVYIINDALNPENNGKVFLFSYGKKIYDKIVAKINPEFADESAVNVFDFWTGANFKLKIKNVEGYRNYDSSTFDNQSEFMDGDESKLEAIWKTQYKLSEFMSESNFKSEQELDKKFMTLFPELFNHTQVVSSATETFSSRPQFAKSESVVNTAQDDEDSDLELYKSLLG